VVMEIDADELRSRLAPARVLRELHGYDEKRVQCDAIERRAEFRAGELRIDPARCLATLSRILVETKRSN